MTRYEIAAAFTALGFSTSFDVHERVVDGKVIVKYAVQVSLSDRTGNGVTRTFSEGVEVDVGSVSREIKRELAKRARATRAHNLAQSQLDRS